MEATKEKPATHTPGPWVISCIEEVKDSLMVGGGDDGSDIVADIRTYENDILTAQAELYDDIPIYRSRINVHGNCWVTGYDTESLDKREKEERERLAEIESKQKEVNGNARLIAQSPAMYDLLCKISNSDLGEVETAIQITLDAREVLAKVEGGEG